MDPRIARFSPAAAARLVVKIGSSLLVDADGRVRRDWLAGVLDDLVERHAAGQGIVIGRLPFLADLVRTRKLVAPFRSPAASRRGYFVTLARQAAHNPSAGAFADWLLVEAQRAGATHTPRRT